MFDTPHYTTVFVATRNVVFLGSIEGDKKKEELQKLLKSGWIRLGHSNKTVERSPPGTVIWWQI